jgi:3-oxoacyl-[acyl-carrier protein] reductase
MPHPYLSQGAALVIGGSGGMGSVVAETLAAQGAHVAIAYRSNRARAETVAECIRAGGGAVSLHALDIRGRALAARQDAGGSTPPQGPSGVVSPQYGRVPPMPPQMLSISVISPSRTRKRVAAQDWPVNGRPDMALLLGSSKR